MVWLASSTAVQFQILLVMVISQAESVGLVADPEKLAMTTLPRQTGFGAGLVAVTVTEPSVANRVVEATNSPIITASICLSFMV